MIDPTHWENLQQADPGDVCRRSGAEYRSEEEAYLLKVLSDQVRVSPFTRQVEWLDSAEHPKPPGFHYWLLTVCYLLGAKDISPRGEWAPYRALPYGQFFFRGNHEIPTAAVADRYGDDGSAFLEAAQRLDGAPENGYGDYAATLPLLPRVPLLYVLWEGDEEFPPRVNVMFDPTISEHLMVDAILSGCEIATKALVAAGDR